jgi:hypothetical protein
MTQADPWDEIPRLEKQMEAELLVRLQGSGLRVSKAGERTEPTVTLELPRFGGHLISKRARSPQWQERDLRTHGSFGTS